MACECCDEPFAGFWLYLRSGNPVTMGASVADGETMEDAWQAVLDFDWTENGNPELEWQDWGPHVSHTTVDMESFELVVATAYKMGEPYDDFSGFGAYWAQVKQGQYQFRWFSGTTYVKVACKAKTQHRVNGEEGTWITDSTETLEFSWTGGGVDDDFVTYEIDSWPESDVYWITIDVGIPELPEPSEPSDVVTAHMHETRVIITEFKFTFVQGRAPSSEGNGFPEP